MTTQAGKGRSDSLNGHGNPAHESLFAAARGGSIEDLGSLLEGCRQYLLLVANEELNGDLHAKGGASDLVQETFLEAQRDFSQFHGENEEQLLAWLRKILKNNLANFIRRFRGTQQRQIGRERSLDSNASDGLNAADLFDDTTSPSARAIKNEDVELLQAALGRLTEDDRNVLTLRHRDLLAFKEIGRHMNRSPDAVRMLWWRAIERLADELDKQHGHPTACK